MNPRAGITDLLVFEARPFSRLGTPPKIMAWAELLLLYQIFSKLQMKNLVAGIILRYNIFGRLIYTKQPDYNCKGCGEE